MFGTARQGPLMQPFPDSDSAGGSVRLQDVLERRLIRAQGHQRAATTIPHYLPSRRIPPVCIRRQLQRSALSSPANPNARNPFDLMENRLRHAVPSARRSRYNSNGRRSRSSELDELIKAEEVLRTVGHQAGVFVIREVILSLF